MICYQCMREYSGQICPHCGFNRERYEPMPTALLPMTCLQGRYLIGATLGKGGFGITYIGYDKRECRKVAVKEYFPTSVAWRDGSRQTEVTVPADRRALYEAGVKRFYDEAVTLSGLRDIPAIVNIYDFFRENHTAYIVMEFIDGTAVDRIVLNQGALDVDVTLTIYYPIIQALREVHEAGILHRDISPGNVMLDEKFRARLIDFGSSRAYSHELSSDLTVILKKGFAPIEQYSRRGKHGPGEDVYAICASMYYTLCGRVPPAAPDRRVFDTLLPLRQQGVDIPPAIEAVILKGMAVEAEDRYPDMAALCHAIDGAVCSEQGESAEEKDESVGQARRRRKTPRGDARLPQILLAAASGLLLLILLVVLILIL